MLPVDFHAHTIASQCGLHTILEMLTAAKAKGLAGLALTDHGPASDSMITSVFFDRLKNPVAGIRLLKGLESNVLTHEGHIDFPQEFIPYADIVLVGFHGGRTVKVPSGGDAEYYTDILIRAFEVNPCIDIVSHPHDPRYPLDFDRLAAAAAHHGVALEFNNSRCLYNKTTPELTRALATACLRAQCPIVVSSDAHTVEEIGCEESVIGYVREAGIEDLMINATAESAFAFVERRRKNKKA